MLSLDTIQDLLCKLGMKPCMQLQDIIIFSLTSSDLPKLLRTSVKPVHRQHLCTGFNNLGRSDNFMVQGVSQYNDLKYKTGVHENQYPPTIRKGGWYPTRSETSPSKTTPIRSNCRRRNTGTESYYLKPITGSSLSAIFGTGKKSH